MELRAVIEALKYLKTTRAAIIYTDSRYVTTNLTDNLDSWLKNEFKTSKGEIRNKDLWIEISSELKSNVKIVWIKTRKVKTAHSQYNQIAHFLAKAMTKQEKQ
jgi:ribonuclease HI